MQRPFRTATTVVAGALILATMGSALAQRPGRPARSRLEKPEKPLQVGDQAIDFDLKLMGTKDGKGETVKLSSYEGKQPVVLIFGSYT